MRRSALLVALAVAGLVVSGYLAAFQLGVIGSVWDPLFAGDSERVLTSSLSQALPIPDAALGFLTYAIEATLSAVIALRPAVPHTLRLALAGVASLGGLTAIGLMAFQVAVVHALCTLCVVSAVLSIALAVGAIAAARTQGAAGSGQQHRPEESEP